MDASGTHGSPKLLMKGSHQICEDDAVKSLLLTLSGEVSRKIAANLHPSEMGGSGEWKRPRHFTTSSGNGGVLIVSGNGTISTSAARPTKQVGHEDVPPAYKK